MIAIVNIGKVDRRDPDPFGERRYEVRINREVIASFSHVRGDGLAECLRAAAEAVEHQREQDAGRLLEQIRAAG